MATLRRAMACLALILVSLPAHSVSALAQAEKQRPPLDGPTIDPKTLGGQFKDMTDPGGPGAPLPPPPMRIEPKGLDTVGALCGQLKEAGASPSYCK